MKKVCLLIVVSFATVLQFCTSAKKVAKVPAKITYMANVQPLMVANCAPCHFPPKGNKEPYDTYAAVKADIDEILVRVQKNPGDRGFMPFKHPKLGADTINVLVKWKADGLLEK